MMIRDGKMIQWLDKGINIVYKKDIIDIN
jgi:hypothetical protein